MATRATPTRTTPTRTPPSPAALGRAVEPFELERFLAEHWERQPLVVPRGEEGRFDDLLSTRDVERLITETGIRLPAFRLVKAGETVSGYAADLSWRPAPFTGVADVHRVLEEFERGATIVLQGLHHLWLPLARYCRQLEAFLGHPVQANAYYTPAGSQGLPGPPRHARGDLAPGRRLEAVARLRAGAGAAAEEPALPLGARRAGRAGARRHPARGRHALPAARLAPPGADLGRRLAPHHRRRQRQALGRRGARRARRRRGRARLPADDRRGGAAGAAGARRRRRPGAGTGALRPAAAGRSSTASSRSCVRLRR